MKKLFISCMLILALTISGAGLYGCSKNKPTNVSLSVETKTVSVTVGQSVQVGWSVSPSDAGIQTSTSEFFSCSVDASNKKIVITGVKEGTDNLTVSAYKNGKRDEVTIAVTVSDESSEPVTPGPNPGDVEENQFKEEDLDVEIEFITCEFSIEQKLITLQSSAMYLFTVVVTPNVDNVNNTTKLYVAYGSEKTELSADGFVYELPTEVLSFESFNLVLEVELYQNNTLVQTIPISYLVYVI